MFEQLKQWLNENRRQVGLRRPRIVLNLEALEERWCPASDVYLWNPPAVPANLNASNSANWEKNGVQQGVNGTIPGNNTTDIVQLNGAVNNSNIVWNQSFSFSKLYLMGQYSGIETIAANNTTLQLTV